MRDYKDMQAKKDAIAPILKAIRTNLSDDLAICLMSDAPWSDYRVLAVTRDRVLRAADREVRHTNGGDLNELVVGLDVIDEAAVWHSACTLLDSRGLFCAWPADDLGRARFLQGAAGLGIVKVAQELVSSIARTPAPARLWKAYVSEKLHSLSVLR